MLKSLQISLSNYEIDMAAQYQNPPLLDVMITMMIIMVFCCHHCMMMMMMMMMIMMMYSN